MGGVRGEEEGGIVGEERYSFGGVKLSELKQKNVTRKKLMP